MFKHLYSDLGLFKYPNNEKSLKDMVYKELTYKKNSHDKLLKIAYFLMTFGENYKYFKPISFSRGNLIEEKINHFGPIVNFFMRLKLIKY